MERVREAGSPTNLLLGVDAKEKEQGDKEWQKAKVEKLFLYTAVFLSAALTIASFVWGLV